MEVKGNLNVIGDITAENLVLQQIYDNSTDPEIITSSGALTLKNGGATDTDIVFEVRNLAGGTPFLVRGNGVIAGNGSALTNVKPELQKTLVLESPLATDDILLMELSKAITITKVTHQIFGATNVSFNINHSGGTDLWATDKVATTTKVSETVFTDATCTANNQVRYQASAISGTPSRIEITLTYTEN